MLTGCYDNKQALALALLFPKPTGRTITADIAAATDNALTAAFQSRFPPKSSFENFRTFIVSLSGVCFNKPINLKERQYNIQCEIQTGRVLDVKTGIIIWVKTNGLEIEVLDAFTSDLNYSGFS
jgi:hypothetical protein